MKRTALVAAIALLAAPLALAGRRKERPPRRDTETTEQTSDAADAPILDPDACTEYVVPTHRQIVELRYIAELLPRGPLKRDVVGRLDTLETRTAATAASLCGITDLDRSPPANLPDLDADAMAAAVAAAEAVFGQEIEVSDGVIRIVEVLMGDGRRARGARRPNTARGGTATADAEFEALLAAVEAAPFADEQRAVLTEGADGRSFSCDQIARLLGALKFADLRTEMGVWLSTAATDPENYDAVVVESLPFASEKQQLREALAALEQGGE